MLVGVLSDSHDNLVALREVLQRILEHNVEKVIHLGDIISPFTVKLMKEVLKDTPVIAVRGNNDGDVYQLTTLFAKYNWVFFSEPTVIEISGKRILLFHGYGSPENTRKLVYALANSLDIDALLYGHTHLVDAERVHGKLVLNPGEVCGYITNRKSYALLDLDKLKAEIHFV
ncbi:MAG: metallophosphoesterase [Desulfurococcaceae archaeon]